MEIIKTIDYIISRKIDNFDFFSMVELQMEADSDTRLIKGLEEDETIHIEYLNLIKSGLKDGDQQRVSKLLKNAPISSISTSTYYHISDKNLNILVSSLDLYLEGEEYMLNKIKLLSEELTDGREIMSQISKWLEIIIGEKKVIKNDLRSYLRSPINI